jgi:hypothetical protein
LGFTFVLNLNLSLSLNLLPLPISIGLSAVSTLIAAAAAPPLRTPLAEFAVRAVMLLIIALFQTADESVRRYLKTHSIFMDIFFFSASHSLHLLSVISLNLNALKKIIRYNFLNYPMTWWDGKILPAGVEIFGVYLIVKNVKMSSYGCIFL